MKKEKLGMKTKELWKNPEYRKHMSEVHKGKIPWNKGISLLKQMSKKTNELRKQKISISLKRAYQEGRKKPSWTGKEYPLFSRLKQSKTLKELYKLGIMKSRNQGKTSERHKLMHGLEYRLWRMEIFERDKFTCQMCRRIGRKLRAHHIKSFAKFPELRFEILNGITLCKECHDEVHRKC